jgi:peptide/nickel transport system permease protein
VHVLRKLVLLLPLLAGVVSLIFVLVELSPGTVVDKFITPDTMPEVRERLVQKWRLDSPSWVRYLYMMRNLALLDFGVSMVQERPVFEIIAEALPNTLVLSAITLLSSYPLGILLGLVQGARRGSALDTALSLSSLFFYSMPAFWLALMVQLVFSFHWKILPSSGMYDAVLYDYMSPSQQIWNRIQHVLLPGVAMGVAHAAGVARYMRSSLLEVIRQDFIRTARAKGLSERRVLIHHAARNALLPVITLIGLSLPAVFSGSVLVESIFAWPGMGRLIVQAIFAQDTPLIIACFFVYTLVVAAGSILTDLAYALVDPRIRFDS